MSRRAVGAALCAAAAIALVVAAFAPWWRIIDRGEDTGMRANFSLLGGELCRTGGEIACKTLSYTGRIGLRDELFAWTGRLTLAAILVAATLALVLAFAGGGRRAILRATTATTAAIAAGLGAAVIALEQLPLSGDTQLASGLWAAMIGCLCASAAAAWPIGEPGAIPAARRWSLALGVLALALIAWTTIGLRVWWTGTGTFSSRGMSPLGIELCDRDQCTQLGLGPRRLPALATMTAAAAFAAALVVVSIGLATRVVRGVAPRGWAIATAIVGGLAVSFGAAALLVVPRRGATIGPGAWGFLIAGAGLVALAIVSRRVVRWIDPVDTDAPDGVRVLPFGTAPQGPRPVLTPLAPLGLPFSLNPPTANAAAPNANTPIARSPFAPPAPPAIAPSPYAPPAIAPRAPVVAAPIPRRVAPLCPSCRGATLWHGKRAAWWCTACKQTL